MVEPEGPTSLLPEELHKHVETFGLIFEGFGIPRMAGRIFAVMLLQEEGLVTQAELATELQASTGSISTMIRLLEQLGFAKRVSLPGQRRDRFRLSDDPLVEMSIRRIQGARQMSAIIEATRADDNLGPVAGVRLARAQSFYDFFTDEMDRALQRWRIQGEDV